MRNYFRGLLTGEEPASTPVPGPGLPAAGVPHAPVTQVAGKVLPEPEPKVIAPTKAMIAEVVKPKLESYIDVALSFQNGGILLIGWILDTETPVKLLELMVDGGAVAVEDFQRYNRPDVTAHFAAEEGVYGFALIVPEQKISTLSPLALRMTLEDGSRQLGDPFNSAHSSPGMLDLVRMHWYSMGALLSPKLLSLPGGVPVEVLPALTIPYDLSKSFIRWGLDKTLQLGDGTVVLVGWLFDRDREVQDLQLIDEDTGLVDGILSRAVRTSRPDIVEAFKDQGRSDGLHGLLTSGRVPEAEENERPASADPRNLALYIFTTRGEIIRAAITPTKLPRSLEQACIELMSLFGEREPQQVAMLNVVGPAMQERILAQETTAPGTRMILVGEQIEQPVRTVIVPLKGGVDFFRCQLALFAGDPDFQKTELIFVIDDAATLLRIEQLARVVSPHFGVSFQLLAIDEPVGYVRAVNIAAAQARGKRLVLLDVDVLPRAHGWLGKLERAYRSLDVPGLLSPRLVYEDGTIKHAATYLAESAAYPGWLVDECAVKGIPSWMDAGTEPVAVDLVNLSCVMVDRDLFLLCGGLPEGYLYGGFADAALCRLITEQGRQHYYLPELELDHPERRPRTRFSHPGHYWKARFNLYNCWAFNKLCRQLADDAVVKAQMLANDENVESQATAAPTAAPSAKAEVSSVPDGTAPASPDGLPVAAVETALRDIDTKLAIAATAGSAADAELSADPGGVAYSDGIGDAEPKGAASPEPGTVGGAGETIVAIAGTEEAVTSKNEPSELEAADDRQELETSSEDRVLPETVADGPTSAEAATAVGESDGVRLPAESTRSGRRRSPKEATDR